MTLRPSILLRQRQRCSRGGLSSLTTKQHHPLQRRTTWFSLTTRGGSRRRAVSSLALASAARKNPQRWVMPASAGVLTLVGGCIAYYYSSKSFRIVLLEPTTRGTPSEEDEEVSDASQQMLLLATSSAATSKNQSRLDARILKWIQNVLQTCWDAFLVSLRTTEVALRLSPLVILTPASILADRFLVLWLESSSNNQQQHNKKIKKNLLADFAWWYTTHTLQALGPAWVKLMQWVATRRDIFAPHICNRLSLLHDQGLPHSWIHTVQLLNEAFGDDWQERGLSIDLQAVIGCGSAAQVYRGVLKETKAGKDTNTNTQQQNEQQHIVAIKVLHPNFQRNVERDLWLMETLAKLLHDFIPAETLRMMNLPRAAHTFAQDLRKQADLRLEAANLQQFRRNFYNGHDNDNDDDENNHWSGEARSEIYFPKPVRGWVSEKVLVEEYVADATPIAAFLQDSSPQGLALRKELSGPLLRAFLKMVFLDNFVHGDLHPGNVQVVTTTTTTTNSSSSFYKSQTKPHHKIVFLDTGIATSLQPNDQKNLRDLFRAVILNDGDRAGRLMVERARYERCSQVPGGVDAFAAGVGDIVAEFHDRRREGLTLGAVRIGSLLSRVLDLCRIHGVEIDPAMASIVISTLVLEGLGRSLDPNLNLIEFAIPFVLGRGRV